MNDTAPRLIRSVGVWLVASLTALVATADEGMWLFNALPKDYLKQKYGFEPTDAWADHVMKSSVRFNVGGSASFISSTGLVLTNHHVGSDTLHKLSTAEHNYAEDGFYAKTLKDEIPAPDLELNQLVAIVDVTDRVKSAVKKGMSAAEALKARRAVIAQIEKESKDATGLRSDVVTLYGGGRYHLYRYKRYTDVRLVWAPEAAIAFFGGDADNFEYPRYCLDACIFRVYENGKPAKIEHFLKWSTDGVREKELVFVSGNPGRTSRISTLAALKHQRDVRLPYVLNFIRRREIMLQQFGLEGVEQERRAKDGLFGIQNSRKALGGMLQGLQDPRLMQRKAEEEQKLLAAVDRDPRLSEARAAWEQIARLQKRRTALQGKGVSLNTRLFRIAQTLVQMAAEDQKPNAERLPEFRDSGRDSLLQQLFSPAPIYKDLEQATLADLISWMIELRGGDDPLVEKILQGKGPRDRAADLVMGTRLDQVAFRKKLADGGADAIASCDDPMIVLARVVDDEARAVRKERDEIGELERQAYGKIAEVLFAVKGTSTYPDATFTLRLAFGPVKGYVEDGKPVPAWTTMGGAFEHEKRHGGKEPWKLPASWIAAKQTMDGETPFNFVCTADIVGGNSGSPVINRRGELVGLIFDGNIQSLTADYVYDDKVSRAVSVDARAIREALANIYHADRIVRELGK